MDITVIYSNPNCRPCKLTKRNLDKAGVPYMEVDIESTEGASEYLRDRGFRAAPVVESEVGTWSGYDESKISELILHELGEGTDVP